MYLYVSDFSRKPDELHKVAEEELQDILQKAQEFIKSSKKTLRSIKREKLLCGLSLKSFETVDISVSAPQRKDTIDVISTELSQGQLNDKEKSDKSAEKDDEVVIDLI